MDHLADVFGFAAAAMTLIVFAQTKMLPMRLTAIAANLLFIAYGALGPVLPVLFLHVVLLPVNVVRLVETTAERRFTVGQPDPADAWPQCRGSRLTTYESRGSRRRARPLSPPR